MSERTAPWRWAFSRRVRASRDPLLAHLVERRRPGHPVGHQVGERLVGGALGAGLLEPGDQRIPGVGDPQHPLPDPFEIISVLGEDRLAEVFPGREVPVQGGVADARPAGDLTQRRVEALLTHHLPGGFEQPQPVAPRVTALRRPRLRSSTHET